MKKKKTKTTGKLKKDAWDLLSKIVRREHADEYGICDCVSCGDRYYWKDIQAGHFVDGRHGAILFDERGIFPQCVKCNLFLKGNKIPYTIFMLGTYGKPLVDELLSLGKGAGPVRKWTRIELMELIETYKKRLDSLAPT